MEIRINHIGYESDGPKKAVLMAAGDPAGKRELPFQVVESGSGRVARAGSAAYLGPVDRWKDWVFWRADFTPLTGRSGERYRLEVPGQAVSEPFEIAEGLLLERTSAAALAWFRNRRCAGVWDETDRRVPFVGGRPGHVDVRGGWYDASGDLSKYLSHLSYANYLNPQQSPQAVWNFLLCRDLLPTVRAGRCPGLREELLEEALYGADFLLRMQDPKGYFYTTVFDRWTKDPAQREICSFRTQQGHKHDDYQAGYRQGGGMAIAALARAGSLGVSREHAAEDYLQAAVKGFHHLEAHNPEYLDDGRENIIDDYCALAAAVELFRATGEEACLSAARRRAERMAGRLSHDERYSGWWRADERGERPYFHAAEAGLPVIALLRYAEREPDGARRSAAREAARISLEFELEITGEGVNPFGCARQYIRPLGGDKRSAFFIPHDNESGYWWQGESARLGSLAAAARLAIRAGLGQGRPALEGRLRRYAVDQLDWILGLNPFDACLLHGFGRGNPEYEERWPNSRGGICNGITSGFRDERDIDFLPEPYARSGEHRWRWSEQWIPHGAWYLPAVCAG